MHAERDARVKASGRRARVARCETDGGAERTSRAGLTRSARALANIDAPRPAHCEARGEHPDNRARRVLFRRASV
jgi:hypothetical protein